MNVWTQIELISNGTNEDAVKALWLGWQNLDSGEIPFTRYLPSEQQSDPQYFGCSIQTYLENLTGPSIELTVNGSPKVFLDWIVAQTHAVSRNTIFHVRFFTEDSDYGGAAVYKDGELIEFGEYDAAFLDNNGSDRFETLNGLIHNLIERHR